MDNIAKKENDKIDHVGYLNSKLSSISNLKYFTNIKNNPHGTFLLGIYNFSSLIHEHNIHLAIATTKMTTESQIKEIVNAMHVNICKVDGSHSKQFELFLEQFEDPNYQKSYYKKYSSVLPVDKLSNDLCQIILKKDREYIIASLATVEFIFSFIISTFNKLATNKSEDVILLDEAQGVENSYKLLFTLPTLNLDTSSEKSVTDGITDTFELFSSFFNEINNQFYED